MIFNRVPKVGSIGCSHKVTDAKEDNHIKETQQRYAPSAGETKFEGGYRKFAFWFVLPEELPASQETVGNRRLRYRLRVGPLSTSISTLVPDHVSHALTAMPLLVDYRQAEGDSQVEHGVQDTRCCYGCTEVGGRVDEDHWMAYGAEGLPPKLGRPTIEEKGNEYG